MRIKNISFLKVDTSTDIHINAILLLRIKSFIFYQFNNKNIHLISDTNKLCRMQIANDTTKVSRCIQRDAQFPQAENVIIVVVHEILMVLLTY